MIPETAISLSIAYGWLLLGGVGLPILLHWLIERTAPPGFHIYAEGMEGFRGSFSDPVLIFGPGPDRIQSMKGFFPTAIAAEMAHFPDGTRALAVSYAEMEDAEKAVADWPRMFVMKNVRRRSGTITYTTENGEHHALLLHQGCFMLAFYGRDPESVILRRRASGAIYETSVPSWRLAWLRSHRLAHVVIGLWALVQAFVFVDARLIAQTMPGQGDGVAAVELMERFAAINRIDVPVAINIGEGQMRLVAEWRSESGKWLDFLRIDAPPLAERIDFELDPARREVRVRRFQSPIDWSSTVDGASARGRFWSAVWLPFSLRGNEVSVMLNEGRPEIAAGQDWHFSGEEIEALLREIANASGWRWSPQMALSWPAWLPRPGRLLTKWWAE